MDSDFTPNQDGLLSFDKDGLQFGWDATSVGSVEKCLRYYQLKHLEGWQKNNKSVHLLFGGWYASALEHYAKHLVAGMTHDEATEEVILEALTWTWDRETNLPWESLHNTKTRETLIRTIVWYLEEFKDDTCKTVILPSGKPAVELSFAIPLNETIMYCGHLDKLVDYSDNYYVMDQKTSGATISQRYFSDFTPDIQMSGYTFGGKILYDLPVKGVIIDAVQIAVGFSKFTRGFVHRTAAQLEDWMDSTLQTIDRAREATRKNSFPMNRTACGNYGGCEFRDVCSASPAHRKRLLAADFHREPRWDPLKER